MTVATIDQLIEGPIKGSWSWTLHLAGHSPPGSVYTGAVDDGLQAQAIIRSQYAIWLTWAELREADAAPNPRLGEPL
jgi:hypothetical protein